MRPCLFDLQRLARTAGIASRILLVGLASGPLMAAGITVGAGGSVSLNDGAVDLGCGDLLVAGRYNVISGTLDNVGSVIIMGGTLNGGSGDINLSGDWDNDGGTFSGDTGRVTFNTDCGIGTIHVSGDSNFYDLALTTDAGREIEFDSGSTTSVSGALVMKGLVGDEATDTGKLLKVTSSNSGSPAFLVATGSHDIEKVNVRDSHAQLPGEWIDWGYPEDFDSIDNGGNYRWFRNGDDAGLLGFQVSKAFDDGNQNAEVTVHIECNTGLPLSNEFQLGHGEFVNFEVGAVDATELGPTCRVWEESPAGYEAVYSLPNDDPDPPCNPYTESCTADNNSPEAGCYFVNVHPREGYEQNHCQISNELQPVQFTVYKEWLEPAEQIPDLRSKALIDLDCGSVANGHDAFWSWKLKGDDDVTASVYPRWQGDTVCVVVERIFESAVESAGCEDPYPLEPGDPDVSCTLTNTVFFEGIPTLSPMALALMALLTLGLGSLGIRRLG